VVTAAKKLIDGTRANYKKQNMEGFDLSKLNAAAAKAERRQPRSLADVLADIRRARQQRDKDRAAALLAQDNKPSYKIGEKVRRFDESEVVFI
jgi:cell pole-organizing protein PopZ